MMILGADPASPQDYDGPPYECFVELSIEKVAEGPLGSALDVGLLLEVERSYEDKPVCEFKLRTGDLVKFTHFARFSSRRMDCLRALKVQWGVGGNYCLSEEVPSQEGEKHHES